MAIEVPQLSGYGIDWYQADQTGTEVTKTTVLRGKCDADKPIFNDAVLDSLRETRLGEYGWYTGHSVRTGHGRQYDEIELTCTELTLSYKKSAYYSRFEAVARTESRPLEEKTTQIGDNDETYKVWWNHEVRGDATDGVAPDAGQIATIKAASSIDDSAAYAILSLLNLYWAKTNQARKSNEQVFLDARFPGVQSYGVGREEVKEIVYSRTLTTVKNIIEAVGKLRAPKDHADVYYDSTRTDAANWLITSASYRKNLGWYEAELTYAYAKGGWLSREAVAPATGVYPEV